MAKKDFVSDMEEQLAEYLNSDDTDIVRDIEFFIDGCNQYQIEKEARGFLEKNPNPTISELMKFFDETCPGGLAPGDDGADLLE